MSTSHALKLKMNKRFSLNMALLTNLLVLLREVYGSAFNLEGSLKELNISTLSEKEDKLILLCDCHNAIASRLKGFWVQENN